MYWDVTSLLSSVHWSYRMDKSKIRNVWLMGIYLQCTCCLIAIPSVPPWVKWQVKVFIVLIILFFCKRGSTPPANSITAVEIWLLGCLVILLVSILEVLFSSTLRPGRSNNIGQTGHETHSCCHLHDTSSMPIPMSSINSTSSSRANIVTGSEEFVQVR